MKIAIITPYFPPEGGGLENYAENLAEQLTKRGIKIIIITSGKKEKIEKRDSIKIYRLKRTFKISNTPLSPLWPFKIKKILKKEKPALINAHSPVPFIADISIIIASTMKIPSILTYHSATLYKSNRPLSNTIILLYKILLERITIKKVCRIIGVSKTVGKQFPSKKFEVVYNSLKETKPAKAKKKKHFIFIGSLDKSHDWKGLDNILKALLLNKNQSLIILGKGNKEKTYREFCKKHGLDKRVKFLGWKEGKEKDRLIASSIGLIAYPSTNNDAFPTVILEAWKNLTAPLCADTPLFRELIKNKTTGILIPPNNPKLLAKEMQKLSENPKKAAEIAKQGNKELKKYSWKNQINKFLKIVHDCTH